MHPLGLLPLLLASTALADAAFPVTEIPRRAVPEQPCDGKAATEPLAARYMCQIGMDGVWGESYPCEAVQPKRQAETAYLRFTQFGLPCEIVGWISGSPKRRFDGSLNCRIEDEAPDVIGHEAVFDTRIDAIAGGYRIDTKIDMIKTHGIGPDDRIPRPTYLEHRSTKLSVNVCRRPWPRGFQSDLEKVDRAISAHDRRD